MTTYYALTNLNGDIEPYKIYSSLYHAYCEWFPNRQDYEGIVEITIEVKRSLTLCEIEKMIDDEVKSPSKE